MRSAPVVVGNPPGAGPDGWSIHPIGHRVHRVHRPKHLPDDHHRARRRAATLPALAILALADHDDLRAYARLARLGVRGYGRTFAGGDMLLQTVRLLAAGYTVRAIDAERAALAERLAAIRDRQQAALALVADGRTNEAIAAAPHVSVTTVEGELARLMATLGAANRAQAVAKAYEYGLITPGGLAATLHPYLPDPGPDAGVSAEG